MEKIIELTDDDIKKLFYDNPIIETPFVKSAKVIFADYIASGRVSPYIEEWLIKNIYPYYANTHSNASCGIMMKNEINKTKQQIRQLYNLRPSHQIIFTGNGTTGAINHLTNLIDYKKYTKINIYVSVYEHYSNYLPWAEIVKTNKNCSIEYIPINDNDDVDIEWINNKLNQLNSTCDCFNIFSITGCSNVTGIITPIKEISNIINKYNNGKNNNMLFVDYACSAPYKRIDASYIDAFFISPHKFIGGHSTPGILVADSKLFMNSKPYAPGGGCVKKANCSIIQYEEDLEKKESGGTPNIIGIIKLQKVFDLFEQYEDVISHNEKIITSYIHNELTKIANKYKNIKFIFPNKSTDHRLPIIALAIDDMHYNYIVVLLNDFFGIQTRGGISCCGIFGDLIKKKYNIDGWCRISFHWTMKPTEINYILYAVKFVAKYGNLFKNYYKYDKSKNLFTYSHSRTYNIDPTKMEYKINQKLKIT